MKVMMRCGHCNGTGFKDAPELSRTLEALSRVGWLSTKAMALKLRTRETAMSNRLADLRRLAAVERRGSGSRHSPYEWRRID